MWSRRHLLFERQTGNSLPILEVCGFQIGSFQALVTTFFNISAANPMYRQNSAMPTLYSMVNESGNRNRILEMCKFRIRIQLRITSTIPHQFSPNFAFGSEMWSFRRLLFVRQTGSIFSILEMCGFQFWQFSGFGDLICEQISTKSHVRIKFSNADIVFNGD